jgi:hypothetical protein
VPREEALAAVGDAFVGMEVVDTRLADFKSADPEWLLADNQMNHALVIGDPVKDWRGLDWANLQVSLTIDGKVEVDQKGGLGAVDPVRPLAWMIDHAVRQRGGIRQARRSPPARGPACGIIRPAPGRAARSRPRSRSRRASDPVSSCRSNRRRASPSDSRRPTRPKSQLFMYMSAAAAACWSAIRLSRRRA